MMVRCIFISFSLTNLIFYKFFADFYSKFASLSNQFLIDVFPSTSDYIALIFNIFLGTLILFPIVRYACSGRLIIIRWVARLIQTILFLIATYWILRIYSIIPIGIFGRLRSIALGLSLEHAEAIVTAALLGLFMLAFLLMYLGRHRLSSLLSFQNTLILVFAPFGLFTLLQITYWLATESSSVIKPAFSQSALSLRNTTLPVNRVVIILFDELDFRLSFVERPLFVSLPELDKFTAKSVFFENAYPPSNSTLMSIPSLTTSRMLTGTLPVGGSDLMLQEVGVSKLWHDTPNLFSIAKEIGVKTALVGWYLPYCRIFTDVIDNCFSSSDMGILQSDDSILEKMYSNLRGIIETPNFSFFGQSIATQRSSKLYETMLNKSLNVVADDRYGLVYLHFSIPHAPTIYNSTTKELSGRNSPVVGYFDNLMLVDKTLGQLRAKLEEAGQWDNTTVLLTSDHWWRYSKQFDGKADHRVPFIIKTKNQQVGLEFGATFNNFIMSDLVIDLLKGAVSNSQQVIDFISKIDKFQKPVEVYGFD